MTWREQMEDLAASVWTNRKASWGDVCADVAKFVGKPVPDGEEEDALRHLSTEEVQSVLVALRIETDYAQDHSDLCPECYALPGECGQECGQSTSDLYDECAMCGTRTGPFQMVKVDADPGASWPCCENRACIKRARVTDQHQLQAENSLRKVVERHGRSAAEAILRKVCDTE